MPLQYRKIKKPAFTDNGYQSDDSEYTSSSGTKFRKGKKLGQGAYAVAYKLAPIHLETNAAPVEQLVVLSPRFAPLVRCSTSPQNLSANESQELEYYDTYLLYGKELYYADSAGTLTALAYPASYFKRLNSLFPSKAEELLFPSKKRCTQFMKILAKKVTGHSIDSVLMDEFIAKLAFNRSNYPSANLGFFPAKNDARLVVKYIPGISYSQVRVSSPSEQIGLFLSAVRAVKEFQQKCYLITLNGLEIMGLLKKELQETVTQVPTYLLSDDKLYYIDANFHRKKLACSSIDILKKYFPEASGMSIKADQNALSNIQKYTKHTPEPSVFIDLKTDNMKCTFDIVDGIKVNFQSYLIDGGDWRIQGQPVPALFMKDNNEMRAKAVRNYTHYAPECYSVTPKRTIAHTSGDVYSTGVLMQDMLPQDPHPALLEIITACQRLEPTQRPTLNELELRLLVIQNQLTAPPPTPLKTVDENVYTAERKHERSESKQDTVSDSAQSLFTSRGRKRKEAPELIAEEGMGQLKDRWSEESLRLG